MSAVTVITAATINEQHRLAMAHARDAVEHARRAGELLLQIKAELPHGTFLAWLQANVEVTPRQAQRYMAAAQGKALPVRSIAKSDTVSHLPRRESDFEPVPGCAMWTHNDDRTFFVEQSTHDEYFFVCALELVGDDDAAMDYLRRPIRADHVEPVLQQMGLSEPGAMAWRIARGCRVSECLGSRA